MNNNNLEPTRAENVGKAIAVSVNAIPVVGGVLSDIANEIIAKRQNRRLHAFLYDLATKWQSLSESINQDFIRTEEFHDLAEDIFSKAAETRQREKLEALKAIFLNTIISSKPNYDEAAEIAQLIDRWQPRHIIMLKILADPKTADMQMGEVVGRGSGTITSLNQILKTLLPEWSSDQIERTWEDLYDSKIHRTQGTKTMITDTGIDQLQNRLSEYGKKVASYLKQPA